jgi:hypothetical protein
MSIVHRLLRFMDSPGNKPKGFHNRVLGLMGDIIMPTSTLLLKCQIQRFTWWAHPSVSPRWLQWRH